MNWAANNAVMWLALTTRKHSTKPATNARRDQRPSIYGNDGNYAQTWPEALWAWGCAVTTTKLCAALMCQSVQNDLLKKLSTSEGSGGR